MAPKCTRPPRIFLLLCSLLPHSNHFTIYLPIAEFLRGAAAANGGSSPTSPPGMPGWQVQKPSCLCPSKHKGKSPLPVQAGTVSTHRTGQDTEHPTALQSLCLVAPRGRKRLPPCRELRSWARETAATRALGTQHAPHGHSSSSGLNPPVSPRREQGRSQRYPLRGLCPLSPDPHVRTDFFSGGCRKTLRFPSPRLGPGRARQHRGPADLPCTGAGRGTGDGSGARVLPPPAAGGTAQGGTAAARGCARRYTLARGVHGGAHRDAPCKAPRAREPSSGGRGRPRDGSGGTQPRPPLAPSSPEPPARRTATRCCP